MIRAVLDSNIIISAIVSSFGYSRQVLLAAQAYQFVWVVSQPIITEVLRALRRPRVQRRYGITETDVLRVLGSLTSDASMTELTVSVRGVATHPEDDAILATVASSQADYLVTGDRQLLLLGGFRGTENRHSPPISRPPAARHGLVAGA